jgi:hypothetical protein
MQTSPDLAGLVWKRKRLLFAAPHVCFDVVGVFVGLRLVRQFGCSAVSLDLVAPLILATLEKSFVIAS